MPSTIEISVAAVAMISVLVSACQMLGSFINRTYHFSEVDSHEPPNRDELNEFATRITMGI